MADILLIHGSAHGAWCWRDTLPELERLGHSVTALDLPGHGADSTPVGEVTLDKYAGAIIAALDTPKVLVGHSMGGYPISLVAERRPELVQHLVYLCAYVPKAGYSLAEMRMDAGRQPLLSAIMKSSDGISFSIDPDQAKEKFYADCNDAQVAFAKANLCAQAIQPSAVPVELTRRYAQIPRSYIRCLYDGAIPYEYQVRMTDDWPEDRVVDMATSHSPFLSDPAGLAAHINEFIT